MAYEIEWDYKGVIFRYTEVVTNNDIIASNNEGYAHDNYQGIKYQIVDFTGAEKILVDDETVEMIAAMDGVEANNLPADLRIAFVGTQDNLKRVFDTYSKTLTKSYTGWSVGYFYDIEVAKAWVE